MDFRLFRPYPHFTYNYANNKTSAELTEQNLTSLQSDDLIDYVEPDDVVTTQ
jgi:hypothetical protein